MSVSLRASSGTEAVARAAEEDFAIILLDLQMPELDGLETAAFLKKAERSHAVPIIILTANEPSRDTLAKGYASGAVDFLYKPLDAGPAIEGGRVRRSLPGPTRRP